MKLLQELFKLIPRDKLQEASSPSKPWQIRLRKDGEDNIVAPSVMPEDVTATLKKLSKKYKVDVSEFEMFRHGSKSFREAGK